MKLLKSFFDYIKEQIEEEEEEEKIFCPTGKKVYTNQKHANRDVNYIKKVSSKTHIPKRSYRCDICKMWHLTSSSSLRKKEEEAPSELLPIHPDKSEPTNARLQHLSKFKQFLNKRD